MPNLITYNDGYNAAYYSGTGSTQLVPYVFPVAINGRPYMIDTKSNEFARQFDARSRDTIDQSSEPGEAAINPQGLWRRSQSSWHYGAGQTYADTADAEPYRFKSSKGIDVWTKGKLSLLKDTEIVYASSYSNLYMASADGRIYGATGQSVLYFDGATTTAVTGTDASPIYSMTSDGYNVFYSYNSGDIDQTNAGIGTSSNYITGIEAGRLKYTRGRLMVAGQGADKNKIWNITTTPGTTQNNPSALFTHPNTNFNWVDFAGGQNQIYCAGTSGSMSLIYKTAIKADGSALDIPTVAAELPLGEVVTAIEGYLGYVVIGLTNGFRFCTPDNDGNLVVGPLIETGTSVTCFAGIGKYIYFGWTNYDSTSTGIGRMDVSTFISTNQPAYASDLMATAQGAVVDIHEYFGLVLFTVAGYGAYAPHATELVSSGTIEAGTYRWGIPDSKFIPKWDVRTEPLAGSISLSVSNDSAAFEPIGTQSAASSLQSTFDGLETNVYETAVKLTLSRSATDSSAGPVLTRWMGRAYAAPLRSQIFSVPLLLHHKLNIKGNEYWMDVDTELTYLRDLVESPRVVSYQENAYTYSVIVEDVRWVPVDNSASHNRWDWNGTCTVIMRSVR